MHNLWNLSVPRYTSYPTAPQFGAIDETTFRSVFETVDTPLSVYIHIPFCKTMCLFCGCSVTLNRDPKKQSDYLAHLLQEITLLNPQKRRVTQLHLGGGTPTSLTEEEFSILLTHLHQHFTFAPDAELSIEIDPRTVFADKGHKLTHLRSLGFNRVSFGVQDLDPLVQEAVRRRQTEEMTASTIHHARALGFSSVNVDLIYGLPLQTPERFSATIERIIELQPDRIALYSYAKVPWLKPHQKAIPDSTLPTPEIKLQLYTNARAALLKAGYTAIGMDHFALPNDSLSHAYHAKTLTRNFQGYSIQKTENMLGLGVSSIGYLGNHYFQNTKHLNDYQNAIASGHLPIARGYALTPEDQIRRQAILSLMCRFELEKASFGHLADLTPLLHDKLLFETPTHYIATDLGRLFIRVVASHLDAHLHKGAFSSAV